MREGDARVLVPSESTLGVGPFDRSRIEPRRPNKRMQLTKLRAAPERRAEVPPCAPAGEMDGGTASQLIRGVGRAPLGRTTYGRT
jgi:hypothetical protein